MNKNQPRFTNRDLLRISIPLMIEQLLSLGVGLADSLMVAQVGEAAISAVSLVDTVNLLLIYLFTGIASGGAAVVGQYLGRNDREKANHSSQQLMLITVEISLLIMALFYLGKGFVLNVVYGDVAPDVAAHAETYYTIVESSIPFLAIYSVGAGLFRIMGSTKISMWVSFAMNAINVAGNAIMILGLGMGVEGVAIPTLISRVVAAAAMVVLLRKKDRPVYLRSMTLRHDKDAVRDILRFGLTNGAESCSYQMGRILLLSTVSGLGTAAVAANAIGGTLTNLQAFTGNAMDLVMVTVVAQCVGARDYEAARYYTWKIIRWSYVAIFFSCGAVVLLRPMLMAFYHVSPETEWYAAMIVWMYAAGSVVLWPVSFVLPYALRSAGDTKYTMVVTVASMWLTRVLLGVVLVRVFHYGVLAIWVAGFVDWAARAIVLIPRFASGKWKTMGVK